MAKNPVICLTNKERNMSLANKNKKPTTKKCLKNPFQLDLPKIKENDLAKIEDKLREVMRRNESVGKFVIGFNAVMRGIEKAEVRSIFVNKSAEPDYLVRSFIPICTSLQIPIIAIDCLPKFVEHLGIRKCLAVGISCSVENDNSQVNVLYKLTCKALGIKELFSSALDTADLSESSSSCELSPLRYSQNIKPTISSERLKEIYLRRKTKTKRMFIPVRKFS